MIGHNYSTAYLAKKLKLGFEACVYQLYTDDREQGAIVSFHRKFATAEKKTRVHCELQPEYLSEVLQHPEELWKEFKRAERAFRSELAHLKYGKRLT